MIPFKPDIIHAHHNIVLLSVLRRFKDCPVVFLYTIELPHMIIRSCIRKLSDTRPLIIIARKGI